MGTRDRSNNGKQEDKNVTASSRAFGLGIPYCHAGHCPKKSLAQRHLPWHGPSMAWATKRATKTSRFRGYLYTVC